MKIQELTELGPKVDPAEIDAFEKAIGFALPKDYREFLQHTNGGIPLEGGGFFYIESMDRWNQVSAFYRLRKPEVAVNELKNVLKWCYKQYPARFSLASGKLPVASDPRGNEIYLCLAGPERGGIYFWVHDAGNDQDDKLNSSFGAFLESIREQPPETQFKH